MSIALTVSVGHADDGGRSRPSSHQPAGNASRHAWHVRGHVFLLPPWGERSILAGAVLDWSAACRSGEDVPCLPSVSQGIELAVPLTGAPLCCQTRSTGSGIATPATHPEAPSGTDDPTPLRIRQAAPRGVRCALPQARCAASVLSLGLHPGVVTRSLTLESSPGYILTALVCAGHDTSVIF